MKKNKGRKLGETSMAILKGIGFGFATFVDVMLTMPPDHYQAGAFRVKYRRPYQKKMYDLERRGYLKRKIDNDNKKDNQSFFHLTPKGKLELLKHLHLEKILKGKWDGRWRVAVFDIPEEKKKFREYLRKELRALRFQQLQMSVYITPYPVTKELEEYLREWNLRKYIRYLTVTEIDGERELKKIFGLK